MYETEVTIVGCGLRKTGIGKNGQPYDFIPVAFTYLDKNMQGVNVGQTLVSGAAADRLHVELGTNHKAFLVFGIDGATGKYGLLRVALMD